MKNLKLKAARAGLDMSQADLAEAVGVSRQTISAIEKGRRWTSFSGQRSEANAAKTD